MRTSNSYARPLGAVFTPLRWAKWLVREFGLAQKWMRGATVCDPTAGEGVFIHALMDVIVEMDIAVDDQMLSRLFVIERETAFLQAFHASFRLKYSREFPRENSLCADVVLRNPGIKFDVLLGNPPWANFNDLPAPYKETLKSAFLEFGLVEDPQSLLLGRARVDFSALVVSVVLNRNLAPHGEAIFFLPLSLFLNDGAHSGFRRYSLNDSTFQLAELWDFKQTRIFPDIATRFGVARFQRDAQTQFPIPYRIETTNGWISRMAAPVGEPSAPLSVFDSQAEYAELTRPVAIEVRENQKPRQGVNTCGANRVFIFDSLPEGLPGEFLFPLITSECFRNGDTSPRRHVLLPYDTTTGKPLTETALCHHPALWTYLLAHRDELLARKGTMLNTWLKRGLWWALLGVGDYSFAPFKVVWEAYGKDTFNPRVFSAHNGKPWQANQAMHAFIPCATRAEAERLLDQLASSRIERYLRSMSMEGTCNWAQPGRIKRFLKFVKSGDSPACELPLFAS
ncbi:MAG: SAM-dependent DNA methyltransferase [Verrucomicrobia bacterium]|nr:SAM-dependent DNA methyltransferase [Verrucomicrobiota bacterium]